MTIATTTTTDDNVKNNNKRKTSTPPDGYVCKNCGITGHWIQQCSTKKKGNKKQKKQQSNHIPIPGVDPSTEDKELAKEMQKIPPPNCYCGILSRLKKVKRSHQGGETSRAIGKYFFFCNKGKLDTTKCKFAKPAITDDMKVKARGPCRSFLQNGTCNYGDKCMFSHDVIPAAVAGGGGDDVVGKGSDNDENGESDEEVTKKRIQPSEEGEEENVLGSKKMKTTKNDPDLVKDDSKADSDDSSSSSSSDSDDSSSDSDSDDSQQF